MQYSTGVSGYQIGRELTQRLLDREPVGAGESSSLVRRVVNSSLVREIGLLLAVVVVLEMLTFWTYFSGTTAPTWDFFSQYNTDAYAWWHTSTLISPAQWTPNAWGGFPSILDVQNSSWYLPVGIAAALTPFTIHVSAAVAAIHVAFGSIGMYALVRALRLQPLPALVGAVGWFFAAGFYSNAEHVDIARAYAWVPWILLVTSSAWRWNRWWRWPVAVLLLWQAILGMYPGILVSTAYAVVVWIVLNQLWARRKLRAYLGPVVLAGTFAVLMALLRYYPVYLLRGVASPIVNDSSKVTWDLLGTFLYPYSDPGLPNDWSMRSFFLAAPILALIPLVQWRDGRVRALLGVAAIAVVIGFPWPWHNLLRHLPGLNLSEFMMSDFKVYLLAAMCGLGAIGAERLLGQRGKQKVSPWLRRPQTYLWAGMLLIFLVWGIWGHYPPGSWTAQYSLLVISILVAGYLLSGAAVPIRPAVIVLVVVTAGSGLTGQWATAATWSQDRIADEESYFGTTVHELIQEGSSTATSSVQRPARIGAAVPVDPNEPLGTHWGAAFYNNTATVFGYVNLKGSQTFQSILQSMYTPTAADSMTFWEAPGMLAEVSTAALPSQALTQACSTQGSCGDNVSAEPLDYRPGQLSYQVRASQAVQLAANEAYYRGWSIVACRSDRPSTCQKLVAFSGNSGEMRFDLPAGTWKVSLSYAIPGQRGSFIAFGVALMGTIFAAVAVELIRRRRSHEV